MDAMGRRVGKLLHSFLEQEPLRVFCIAYDTKLVDIAKDAAFECLRKPLSYLTEADIPELYTLNAAMFLRLLRYHKACSIAAVDAISVQPPYEMDWVTSPYSCWFKCRKYEALPLYSYPNMFIKNHMMIVHPRRWWREVMCGIALKLEKSSPLDWDAVIDSDPLVAPSEVQQCAKCAPAFHNDMLRLLKDMKPAIESAVRSKVSVV